MKLEKRPTYLLFIAAGMLAVSIACAQSGNTAADTCKKGSAVVMHYDTIVMPWGEVRIDSTLITPGEDWKRTENEMALLDSASRYVTLTEADFRKVAEELDVELAVIMTVVRIEAGIKMEGFWAPGVPVVNFDRAMYNKSRPPRNVKASNSEQVPAGIKSAYGRKEWSQLIAARKQNLDKANMGTFWGMFQIGGFNYKQCGCQTVQEFVDRMSYSEFEQLELFANFVRNSGMLTSLQQKNWAAFARKYNGASYARRGYHTRMAAEYRKFKAQGY